MKESTFWSESKIYITVVWVMIVSGSGIIWTGIEPVVLLLGLSIVAVLTALVAVAGLLG